MADPAAAAPAPISPQAALAARAATRADRRAGAVAKIQAVAAAEPAAPVAAAAPAAAAAKVEAAPAAPAKAAELEKPDPATERGLRTLEQQKKKWLDEHNAEKAKLDAHKAELEVQRAEIARLRKEAEGKVASREDLKKLSPTDLLEALEHFGEDDFDILSRSAYARTKAGKVDPRAQAAAQEAQRAQGSRAVASQVEELKAAHARELEELRAELRGEFTRRDQASFAERWVGEAVKAIPADKPTFLSKLHANDPDTARRELLTIGAELEKANDGEPPTQAEVIAEFENRKRSSLKALGLDPDALLASPKAAEPAAAAKPAARTLNPSSPAITRPENAPKSREERRQGAIAKIRATARTADQT